MSPGGCCPVATFVDLSRYESLAFAVIRPFYVLALPHLLLEPGLL